MKRKPALVTGNALNAVGTTLHVMLAASSARSRSQVMVVRTTIRALDTVGVVATITTTEARDMVAEVVIGVNVVTEVVMVTVVTEVVMVIVVIVVTVVVMPHAGVVVVVEVGLKEGTVTGIAMAARVSTFPDAQSASDVVTSRPIKHRE